MVIFVLQLIIFNGFAVLLPHIGSSTTEIEEKMAMVTAENILAVLNGSPMPSEVAI